MAEIELTTIHVNAVVRNANLGKCRCFIQIKKTTTRVVKNNIRKIIAMGNVTQSLSSKPNEQPLSIFRMLLACAVSPMFHTLHAYAKMSGIRCKGYAPVT